MSSSSDTSNESSHPSYDELLSANQLLEQENELIKFQLEQLKQYVFGKRSEKVQYGSPGQEQLFGEPPSVDDEEDLSEVLSYKRKRRSKKSIPKDLPVDEVVYEPHETERSCILHISLSLKK